MNRETKRVQLSSCEVEIITFLTWGEKEEIQGEILKGTKMNDKGQADFNPASLLNTKKKALKLSVKKVYSKDGSEQEFTMEWMNNLSIEDGDKLYQAVDEVTKPKKKQIDKE